MCNLYTLLPKKWVLNSNILTSLFVTAPIKFQAWYAKKRYFSKNCNKVIISWLYKPDQYLYLKISSPYIYLHYDNYKGDTSYDFSLSDKFDKTLSCCMRNSLFNLISSSKLYEQYKSINSSCTYYYPNAISRGLLADDLDYKTSDFAKGDVVIGFVGQVDDSFDIALVKKVSVTFKDFKIRLIGGFTQEASEALSGYSNVDLLGYMDYELLGSEIEKFSIGICPYKSNKFNKFRNPLKITEYYSYGLPVVSVDCDIDATAMKFMGISKTDEEFIELVKLELKTDNLLKNALRRKYASENCWDNRADFVINNVKKHFVLAD